jgi:hypothetical protein
VYSKCPELREVGSKKEYSNYLEKVFPDSQIKDVVYHDTDNDFDIFDKDKMGSFDSGTLGSGFYFSARPGGFYPNAKYKKSVILDAKNIALTKNTIIDFGEPESKDDRYTENIKIFDVGKMQRSLDETELNKKLIDKVKYLSGKVVTEKELSKLIANSYKELGYDGIKSEGTTAFGGEEEFVVFELGQIHILGSKKDIDNFKVFVKER